MYLTPSRSRQPQPDRSRHPGVGVIIEHDFEARPIQCLGRGYNDPHRQRQAGEGVGSMKSKREALNRSQQLVGRSEAPRSARGEQD